MTQNRPPRGKPARPGEKPRQDSPRQDKPRPDQRPDQRTGQRTDQRAEKRLDTRSDTRPDKRQDRPASDNRLSLPGAGGLKPDRGPQGSRPPEREPQREQKREHGRGGGNPGRSGPAVPTGAVWLYGTHAVGAALQNPARRLRRLVITEEAQEALAAECPKPWPIQPEITPRDRIDAMLGARPGSGIVHQGIALLADQLQAPALLDALKRPGPVVVLDQIFDPRNVGALMRTAQAFGACAVITQDRNAPEETGALAKAASGALETIPLLRIVNIARALIVLKSADVWVVGLDGHAPTKLNGPSFGKRRVALVLGSEGEGMRRLTRETCDEICGLAMPGGMESLNVSAAGAVALYELTRSC